MPESSTLKIAFAESVLICNPENGADIIQLTVNGKELIKPRGLEKAENPWLFPFPNRLSKGRYDFEGKTYQFEINDHDGLSNALHGFIRNRPFVTVDERSNKEEASLTLGYSYEGELGAYPFPFQLDINYHLSAEELIIKVKLLNTGQFNMPAGLGWHPYFHLHNGKGSAELRLPPGQEIEVNEEMIPTGKKSPSTCFDSYRNLREVDLDTCFEINNKGVENSVNLKVADAYEIAVWQDASHSFVQVFTHPLEPLIAIEPMTCGINAFNTGEGLKVIAPREVWELSCGVRLH